MASPVGSVLSDFGRRSMRHDDADDLIDVVVPVHDNIEDANRLMASLATARLSRPYVLHVVDDGSRDPTPIVPPPIGGALRAVERHRNVDARGFAAAVNLVLRGGSRDVVILNSDTLVYDFWLDRLRAAAKTRPRVATVTPMSNNATILSYPGGDSTAPLETDWRRIDALCAEFDPLPLIVPTGIGFCMLITRACLDDVGAFDDVAFRDGYGEECDFCRRAVARRWTNLAATNVFVWHRGEGSFGARAAALRARATVMMTRRHPSYDHAVRRHVGRDPLAPLRLQLDLARLKTGPAPRVVRFRPAGAGRQWAVEIDGYGPLPNLPQLHLRSSPGAISALLAIVDPAEIILDSDRGLSPALAARIAVGARARGCPVVWTAKGPAIDWSIWRSLLLTLSMRRGRGVERDERTTNNH